MNRSAPCLAYWYADHPAGGAGIEAMSGPLVTPPTVCARVSASSEAGSAPKLAW